MLSTATCGKITHRKESKQNPRDRAVDSRETVEASARAELSLTFEEESANTELRGLWDSPRRSEVHHIPQGYLVKQGQS